MRTQGTAIVGLSENQSSLYAVFMHHTLTSTHCEYQHSNKIPGILRVGVGVDAGAGAGAGARAGVLAEAVRRHQAEGAAPK